ncbi:glutathione S-transferase family protein [Pacificoceanicola onchidii]|uniref:glutathione S-transferase family protein n=1 Tax=Pacificoceanicola onchidii TaxID=2562685 RepID=UPI0010A5CAA1|nr:glutathione S-transferase family protein [Pacificoceanicola onchidii]
MLTLYYAPQSRATRIVQLIEALGVRDKVDIRQVSVVRADGSGGRDPANPHPDGKVPLLEHDGQAIRESNAIMIHLTTLFPEAGLAPAPGTPEHGAYLGWMTWYGNVVEPVLVAKLSGIEHPAIQSNFRGWDEVMAELETALASGDYLMGARFTAVDILVGSIFAWVPGLAPDSAAITGWIARCQAHPSFAAVGAFEAEAMAEV